MEGGESEFELPIWVSSIKIGTHSMITRNKSNGEVEIVKMINFLIMISTILAKFRRKMGKDKYTPN